MSIHWAGATKMNSEGFKGSVLAIDDDPAVVADLARILSVGGYLCHCCRDLAGAVERFRIAEPDLVIADLGLVGPNGYRLVEAISREMGYMDVPLMFLSDAQGPDVIHRHSDAGGAYFLRKPLDVVVLLELVDKALWSRRLCPVR
jgi:two-component system response regulator MtrA